MKLSIVPLTWLVIFFAIPLFNLLRIAFAVSTDGMPPYAFPSIALTDINDYLVYVDNIATIVTDTFYTSAYIGSLLLSLSATFLCLLIGYPIAYAIYRSCYPLPLLLFALLPFCIPFLLRIYAWIQILSPYGIINHALLWLHWIKEPIPLLYTHVSVCIGMTYCYLPFMILPVYLSFSDRLDSLRQASYDLGASPFTTFKKIILPMSYEGIRKGCLLVFLPSFGELVIPELLGGSRVHTIGKVLWSEFFYSRDWPMASALSLVMLATIATGLYISGKGKA